MLPEDLERRVEAAVRHFWKIRSRQAAAQGAGSAGRDRGNRGAATGGKQLDGFRELLAELLSSSGLRHAAIHWRAKTELPGWYRAEKNWDLLVVADGVLLAVVEFKSHVGSFGNNFNNRSEEALGSATDLWAAFAEGSFKPGPRPWLGYLMLLEDSPRAHRPVRVKEPHFKVFPEFRGASYALRYEQLLTKIVRARLYDAACLLLSAPPAQFREPNAELTFRNFLAGLLSRMLAAAEFQRSDDSATASGR